jgi:hypothetical protein
MVSPVVGWRPKTRLTLCPQNPKEFDIRPDHAGADDEMPGDSFRRAHDRPFLADSAAVSISGCVVTSNMCPPYGSKPARGRAWLPQRLSGAVRNIPTIHAARTFTYL